MWNMSTLNLYNAQKKNFSAATLCNKTATDEYLAILLIEDWNNGGLKNISLSSDNAAAGINPVPDNMFNTAFVITKDCVRFFKAAAIPDIKTKPF
jgi:hypothetical protein